MTSVAPHRFLSPSDIAPLRVKALGKWYRLDYIDTHKSGAEAIASLRREDGYSAIVRTVKIKSAHYQWILGQKTGYGVFIFGRGRHGVAACRRR